MKVATLLFSAVCLVPAATPASWQDRMRLANEMARKRDSGTESEYRKLLAAAEAPAQKAEAANNLGAFLFGAGRHAEAHRFYLQALETWRSMRPAPVNNVAQTLNNLAVLCRVQARYAEAEPLLKESLALHEQSSGPKSPPVAVAL